MHQLLELGAWIAIAFLNFIYLTLSKVDSTILTSVGEDTSLILQSRQSCPAYMTSLTFCITLYLSYLNQLNKFSRIYKLISSTHNHTCGRFINVYAKTELSHPKQCKSSKVLLHTLNSTRRWDLQCQLYNCMHTCVYKKRIDKTKMKMKKKNYLEILENLDFFCRVN